MRRLIRIIDMTDLSSLDHGRSHVERGKADGSEDEILLKTTTTRIADTGAME